MFPIISRVTCTVPSSVSNARVPDRWCVRSTLSAPTTGLVGLACARQSRCALQQLAHQLPPLLLQQGFQIAGTCAHSPLTGGDSPRPTKWLRPPRTDRQGAPLAPSPGASWSFPRTYGPALAKGADNQALTMQESAPRSRKVQENPIFASMQWSGTRFRTADLSGEVEVLRRAIDHRINLHG